MAWAILCDDDFQLLDLAPTPEGAIATGRVPVGDNDWLPVALRIAGSPASILDQQTFDSLPAMSYFAEGVPAYDSQGALNGFVFAGDHHYTDGEFSGPAIWLFKTDLGFDPIWESEAIVTGEISWTSSLVHFGDHYLLGGSRGYLPGGSTHGWHGVFDSEGTLQGTYEDGSQNHAVHDFFVQADGGFLEATEYGLRKYNAALELQWTAEVPEGELAYDNISRVCQTTDGSVFYISGRSGMIVLVKTDAAGDYLWELNFGSLPEAEFHPYDLCPTPDGGILLAGTRYLGFNGGSDLWLQKYTVDGEAEWQLSLGDEGDEHADIIEAVNEGAAYLIGGQAQVAGVDREWILRVPGDLAGADTTFSLSPSNTVFRNQLISFDATASTPSPGESITDYVWDFGDGNTASGSTVTHQYISHGNYTVTLSVRQSNSVITQTSQEVEVLPAQLQWERRFGDNWQDVGLSMVQARDGGIIISGAHDSSYADENRLWIWKVDQRGHTEWDREFNYEYQGSEYGRSIIRAHDEGYLVAGNLSFYHGGWDVNAFLLKIDENGDPLWPMKIFGTPEDNVETFHCIAPTLDNHYMVLGSRLSNNKTSPWLLKVDGSGEVVWEHTYEGDSSRSGEWVAPLADGGYALATEANAYPDKIIKVNATGVNEGETDTGLYSRLAWVGPTDPRDEGFVSVGYYDKDIAMRFHNDLGAFESTLRWNGQTDRQQIDDGHYAASCPDGGYLIVGDMFNEDVNSYSAYELALIKTDASGQTEWIERLNSADGVNDYGIAAIVQDDESIIVLGKANSGDSQIWLFKLALNHPPVAAITASSLVANSGSPITFSGSSSTDADGDVVAWDWDFDNGDTATGESVQYSFPAAGNHTVTLTAVDNDGAESTTSLNVLILGFDIWDEPDFIVNQSDVMISPQDEDTIYPKPGSPVFLNWDEALGLHMLGTTPYSGTRSFRAYLQTPVDPDFALYLLPAWSSVNYTLINEHTIEFDLPTSSGSVELALVFADMLPEWTPMQILEADNARIGILLTTRNGVEYRLQSSTALVDGSWESILFSSGEFEDLDQSSLLGDGNTRTVYVEGPLGSRIFYRALMEVVE